EEIQLLEAEPGAQRVEVGDLMGEKARLSLLDRARAPVAALVVEDDLPARGQAIPGVRAVHVGVIEARAAVHQDQGRARPAPDDLVVDRYAPRFERRPLLRG